MRLLNTDSHKLEYFVGIKVPKYAILSHTWGDDEVLFDDAKNGGEALLACAKKGLPKVLDSCKNAKLSGYGYIWIDTCCIDKSSSVELSEAINSMFNWYRHSDVCFAYLADVDANLFGCAEETINSTHFASSRWFTRGWTLQELLAPNLVQFYDSNWVLIGSKRQFAKEISRITGIDVKALQCHVRADCSTDDVGFMDECNRCGAVVRPRLEIFSVSTRLSWASKRQTTRLEDGAYSLLGLFDVNMPLLYGEGLKAFQRLQEEIIRNSDDQSILAWHSDVIDESIWPKDASCFSDEYQSSRFLSQDFGIAISPWGLELDVLLGHCEHRTELQPDRPLARWLAVLNCRRRDDYSACPAILLTKSGTRQNTFERVGAFPPLVILPGSSEARQTSAEAWANWTGKHGVLSLVLRPSKTLS
jgi:hypothetical protein